MEMLCDENLGVDVDVGIVNADGISALHLVAMCWKDAEGLALLGAGLDKGAESETFDINARVRLSGLTALHIAAMKGNTRHVRRLLGDAHIHANVRCIDGYTALHFAAINLGRRAIASHLKSVLEERVVYHDAYSNSKQDTVAVLMGHPEVCSSFICSLLCQFIHFSAIVSGLFGVTAGWVWLLTLVCHTN